MRAMAIGPQAHRRSTRSTATARVCHLRTAATVDEGNNWINLSYGPLALFNNAGESMVAAGSNAVIAGAYSIGAASNAVNGGSNSGAPPLDFFGNPRPAAQGNAADIGAVEFQPGNVNGQAVVSVSPSPLAFGQVAAGTTVTRDLTLANNGGAAFTVTSIGVTPASGPFSRVTTGVTGNCVTALAPGAVCTIRIQYVAPTTVGTTSTGSVAITGSASVTNAPVALSGTSVAVVRSVSAGPNPLAFGTWASTTTSPPQTVTLLNNGNVAVTGITSQVVQLRGTCVTGVPSMLLTPSPLTITLPSGVPTGTGTVTLKNNAPAGGGQVAVTAVTVANTGLGGGMLTWFFSPESDGCSGVTLAPQQSCTASVTFTNVLAQRGPVRTGTITFSENGAGVGTTSKVGQLRGIATP